MNAYTASIQSNRGFTLLEVILAIAITGFLLAGATTIVVSMTNIWADREERSFFEDHVDGVVEFLSASFTAAGMEIALEDISDTSTETNSNADPSLSSEITVLVEGSPGNQEDTTNTSETTSGGLMRISEEPIGWGKLPGAAQYEEPLLNFYLNTPPPLFVNTDDAPVTGLSVFLYFDREDGLSFLWYSLLQEETEDLNDMRRTEISPLVTAMTFVYWDDRFETWEEEDEPKEGEGNDEYLLPRFLKLTFEYQGETKERTLAIPVASTHALIF